MTPAAGAHRGPHEIVVLPGASGMGDLYSAKDVRRRHDVLIEVIPERLPGTLRVPTPGINWKPRETWRYR